MTKIIGSGGGGGKGGGGDRTPYTAPDSLDSKSFANVLDLVSEGEIEGLKDGLKSVFLNNTPLQNSDGTYNFEDVSLQSRNGTASQSIISGFDQALSTFNVGVQVTKADPNVGVTRTVATSDSVTGVRVVIKLPALQHIEDDGDIVGTSLNFKIQMQTDGGGFVDKINDTIKGRTGDLYKKQYYIPLPATFSSAVEIRVLRITENSSDPTRINNELWWDMYAQVTDTTNTYNNSALMGLRCDSEQFSSIPNRAYLIRGIKIAIPNNATVDSTNGRLVYTGTWNGTFGAAQWCSDPVWALWDLLTSSRYGLGDHIAADQLSKFDFYSASQYCNELVSDGFGGQEPRFSCNVCIQGRSEAFNVINSMCAVFRGMPYWSAGSLTVSQDKPVDSSYLFTLANVAPEGFAYSGSSQKNRATVAVVRYFDITLRSYAYEEVKDADAIAKYGVITKRVQAFACTSRGQAQRVGKWLLYSEGNETETVTFKTGLHGGVLVRPGQVIDISDPVKAGIRRGGRIASATDTSITIDGSTSDTDLPDNSVTYTRTLSVMLPDGTVESKTIGDISGSVITVTSAYSAAPNANSIWILETTGGSSAQNLQTSQWRVITVEETGGENLEYQVTALSYNSSKYANIESGIALTQRDFSNLTELPDPPTNFRVNQRLYRKGDTIRAKIIFSWDAVLGVNEYEVRWRKGSNVHTLGNWHVHTQQGPDDEILDITPAYYEFRIFSLNATKRHSTTYLSGALTAAGKLNPPSNVTNFSYDVDPNLGLILTWDKLEGVFPDFDDLDVVGYEIRSTNTGWSLDDANNGSNLVARVSANRFKIGTIPSGTVMYYIKAYDTSSVYSQIATSQTITIGVPAAPTFITAETGIQGDSAVITWNALATTNKYAIDYYEVYSDATNAANLLGKSDTTRFTTPVTWQNVKTFFVRGVDISGNLGLFAEVDITNTPAPAPTVSQTYVDDSITLSWSEVHGSTQTRAYKIKRGSDYISASTEGTVKGTDFTIPVTWSTTQKFWVVAVDANGNEGTPGSKAISFSAPAIPTLTSSFSGENVVLAWAAITGSLKVAEYEIRRGDVFNSATSLGKVDGTTFTTKVDWGQSNATQKFWVVGIDVQGNYGTEDDLDVSVTLPAAPPSFVQEVVDNNVLLRWGDATGSLPIHFYKIKKGSSWAGGTDIGTKQGLFTTVFETVSGTFVYRIKGVDSAGNEGAESTVTSSVNQPPDYVLRSDINSTFNGTKTNAYLDVDELFAAVNTTETYEEHFIGTGSSGSPQYPNFGSPGATVPYALPSMSTGSYVEEVDYGTVLAGTKIITTLTGSQEAGTTTITPTISVKTTSGGAWTDYAGSASTDANLAYSTFATNFRYVKSTHAFSGSGGDDLLKLTGLNIRLETKQIGDSGNGTASASDSGGTTVTFNVSFVDVESITVTPSGTAARIALYDFTDVPNPTTFKVLLYDTSGNRVSGGFSWQARGS